jgi:hypothetical protein
MTWQARWTRLAIADLYHLRFWESIERAYAEAREDLSKDNLEYLINVLRRSVEAPTYDYVLADPKTKWSHH